MREAVRILWEGGIETTESCQGGKGHPFPEPTILFDGELGAGWHALSVALEHGLRVSALRYGYSIVDGLPVGPEWQMTFYGLPIRRGSRR